MSKVFSNKILLNQKMSTNFPSSMLNGLLYLITFKVIKTSIIILFQVSKKKKKKRSGFQVGTLGMPKSAVYPPQCILMYIMDIIKRKAFKD